MKRLTYMGGAIIRRAICLFLLIGGILSALVCQAETLDLAFGTSTTDILSITAPRDIEFTSFKVANPPRLVVDIKDFAAEPGEYLNRHEKIRKVTVSRVGSVSRLVIEPASGVTITPTQSSKRVVTLTAQSEAPKPVEVAPVRQAPIEKQTAVVPPPAPGVTATSLLVKDNAVTIGTSGFVDTVSTFSFPETGRLMFILKDTSLQLRTGRYPLDFFNLSDLEIEQEGRNARLTFNVKPGRPIPNYFSTKDPSSFVVRFFTVEEPKPAQRTAAAPKKITADSDPDFKAASARYKGQKISLDFENAELRQIFRLLSEVNKKNYIIGDDVKGTLSIKLLNVPWDQAFDLILRINNLAAVEEGNVVEIISYAQKVERIKKQLDVEDFNKSREKLGICSVQLRHASAPKVAAAASTILASAVKEVSREEQARMQTKPGTTNDNLANPEEPPKGESKPYGAELKPEGKQPASNINTIFAEPNSNRLIIRDLPSKFPEILRLLSLLDVPDQQVMIEARIVQASTGFVKSLGVQWGVHYRDGSASFLGINSLDTGFGGLIDRTAPTTGTLGDAGLASGISFGTLTSNINLDMRLSAAADMNMAKVVSTPKVATTYGETANIKDGTQYPYPKTDRITGQVSYEFKDAVLSLDVTPTITPGCDVLMKLEVSNDSLGAPINGQVPINKKSAKTTLSVKNGETAVIGGTFINDETERESGVPYLMDIPLLGGLFKSKSTDKNRRELLIFITPRLLNNTCGESGVMKLQYNKLECAAI